MSTRFIYTRSTRFAAAAIILLLSMLAISTSPVYASAPANNCSEPCNICTTQGTCASRWWQDLDTYQMNTYPVQVTRTAQGLLRYTICQKYEDGSLSPWCGGVKPQPISLREWCRRLMSLPVPPRIKPSDEGDLYVLFSSGGVCP